MRLDDDKREILSTTGSQLLTLLEQVAMLARKKLADSGSLSADGLFAGGTNTMVDGEGAFRRLSAIRLKDRENLKRIEREPFVTRVVVRWDDEPPFPEETLYISRASVAGLGVPEAKLVTYGSDLGRLAEFDAGTSETIRVKNRERDFAILERIRVNPQRRDDGWDSVNTSFEFESWRVVVESIQRLFERAGLPAPAEEEIPDLLAAIRAEGAESDLFRDTVRRQVVKRIILRDQPILDRYQGEIFRMPLDRRLALFGPPGTGKTTTLIRRLAQKRTVEALTDEEIRVLDASGLKEEFLYSDSWAMFSPTELLRQYLKDAFNREGVSDRGTNIRTWEKERLSLGKGVLKILKSAEAGRFTLDFERSILSDASSNGVRQLYEEFAAYFERTILDRANGAFDALRRGEGERVASLVANAFGRRRSEQPLSVREIASLLYEGAELQRELRRLDEEIRAEVNRIGNHVLYGHRELLDELVEMLPAIFGTDLVDEEDDEDELEEDDAELAQRGALRSEVDQRRAAAELILAAIRHRALSVARGRGRVGGRAGRVIALIGDRMPSADSLSELAARLGTRAHLRTLLRSPRQYVMGAPQAYARFRRQALKAERLYASDAADAARQNRISPHEADVVILTMLRHARHLFEESPARLTSSTTHDWLENIRSQYLMQVFVDEASDFSAVQLACMMELSHPRLRSWFACGDFDQRITSCGIRDQSDIEWLERFGGTIEVREVTIPYRQSRRLRELATALSAHPSISEASTKALDRTEEADVWPVLAENHSGEELAHWLAERIVEVERFLGELPSIAIFVDGADRVDPLVRLLRPHLSDYNIPVAGFADGRVVGDDVEVRVFDVQHIKGLEFEAVFFVGIDRLAERLPDLFGRYFYVGASRAATYLGVTCETQLPTGLGGGRDHFTTAGWVN